MTAVMSAPAKPAVAAAELRRIPLAELHESSHNLRERYDQTALLELASSLLQTGQLTPIIVRPRKAGGYELAAGHRRYRAAKLAIERSPDGARFRGLEALEAKVVELSDAAFVEILNIENLQRDDLHPLEEAHGFRGLMEKAGYDVAKIAARIGRSPRYVYDSLTLLKLISRAKKLFLDGVFERGHAIELARLTPEQQERALGDLADVVDGGRGESLLLEADNAAEAELPLEDQVKPVSVKEFKQAIQDKIRATPDRVDPFLFPESAAALAAAKEEKLSVIHITRDYLASDEIRSADEKQRVFGSEAWKRADGQVDPYEDYRGAKSKTRSKPCDWSRYGFVASGPGQGEVFRVCINKQKCKIHWPEHVKRAEAAKKRAKTAKPRSSAGAVDADAAADQQVRNAAAEAREDFERQALDGTWTKVLADRKADFIAGAKRRAQQLAKVPNDVILALIDDNTELYLSCGTEYNEQIERLVWPSLPGKWSKGYQWRSRDATAGRLDLGLQLYFALDTGKAFDAKLETAVEAAMKATMKEYDAKIVAAAKRAEKKPARKKAKKGSR
jgi:ParB/RepB/Spo0J family partition protein